MKTIVSDYSIIKTYSTRQQKLAYQYLNIMSILRKNKNIRWWIISKKLNIPYTTLNHWVHNGVLPIPIRAINYLRTRSLLPLTVNPRSATFKTFVRCFAFVFGDGHLCKKYGAVQLSGQKEDLEILKTNIKRNLLIECNVHPDNKLRETYRLDINNAAFARLMYAAGAPKGDKVIQKFLLPQWLMNSPKEVKREFLSVLFGNELETPRIQHPYPHTVESIAFAIHKKISLRNNAIQYLNQIRKLLKEFGIVAGPPNQSGSLIRKRDASKNIRLFFNIKPNLLNVLKFYNEFILACAGHKQKKFDLLIQLMRQYLEEELKKCNIYHETLNPRSKFNWGSWKIAKHLNFSNIIIGHWLHHGSKPRYFGKEDKVKQILESLNFKRE